MALRELATSCVLVLKSPVLYQEYQEFSLSGPRKVHKTDNWWIIVKGTRALHPNLICVYQVELCSHAAHWRIWTTHPQRRLITGTCLLYCVIKFVAISTNTDFNVSDNFPLLVSIDLHDLFQAKVTEKVNKTKIKWLWDEQLTTKLHFQNLLVKILITFTIFVAVIFSITTQTTGGRYSNTMSHKQEAKCNRVEILR